MNSGKLLVAWRRSISWRPSSRQVRSFHSKYFPTLTARILNSTRHAVEHPNHLHFQSGEPNSRGVNAMERPSLRMISPESESRLAEGFSTGATAARVRVVNGETLLRNGVLQVDGRPLKVGHTHLVQDDPNTVKVDQGITVKHTLVEVVLVDQAGATTGLNGNAEVEVVTALLSEQTTNLLRSGLSEANAMGCGTGGNLRWVLKLGYHPGAVSLAQEFRQALHFSNQPDTSVGYFRMEREDSWPPS